MYVSISKYKTLVSCNRIYILNIMMKKSIIYGDYQCSQWNGVIGLNDPLFKVWLEAIKEYLDGYELWVYGGVIEDWLTFDLDATIIGPNDPKRINEVLENIVRVSFSYGLFPDIKYSIDSKLFNWSSWERTGEYTTCKYAYYRPSMIVDGKHIEWGTLENDLWVSTRVWPMKKAIHKDHTYKDPIQIA